MKDKLINGKIKLSNLLYFKGQLVVQIFWIIFFLLSMQQVFFPSLKILSFKKRPPQKINTFYRQLFSLSSLFPFNFLWEQALAIKAFTCFSQQFRLLFSL